MITRTFQCNYCDQEFQRTDYPSRFEVFDKHYCSKRCAMIGAREGYRPTQGIIQIAGGRLLSRVLNHPNRNKNNQVPFASLIMEKLLGRYLEQGEMIHHRDGNPANNQIDNLELMTVSEHTKLHNSLKRRDRNGCFIKSLS